MALYAFDGTWNSTKTGDHAYRNTNVVRFYDTYEKNAPGQGAAQNFYVEGVGTRYGLIGHLFGGIFGLGEPPRLEDAYRRLCANWAAGDHTIDIVGFSRGAATALDFCHLIQKHKIRTAGLDAVIEANPSIRFLGVWDVVAAFGLANLGATDLNIGHHLTLPSGDLQFAFHALALDERRPSFLPTRLRGACEVWFRGVHSDIGGGNGNRGLNDVTMKWMMSKALAAGLPIRKADIDALQPNAEAQPASDDLAHRLARIDVRHVSDVDRRHYTVSPAKDCRMPPATCPVETPADEQQAAPIGAGGVEVLPVEVLERIRVLANTAIEELTRHWDYPLGDFDDVVATLIQARAVLIDTDARLAEATANLRKLIAATVRHAREHQYKALNEFFLNEALFELRPLFPFTDG